MTALYILNSDGVPEATDDIEAWGIAYRDYEARTVAKTEVAPGVVVSTVFLGMDHQYGDGSPLLYESLVFGGPSDGEMRRYETREEAAAGHQEIVEALQAEAH